VSNANSADTPADAASLSRKERANAPSCLFLRHVFHTASIIRSSAPSGKKPTFRATNRRRAASRSQDGPAGVSRVLRPLRRVGAVMVPAPNAIRDRRPRPDGRDLRRKPGAREALPRRSDGSGAPWLFGIARNLLRQYHKHNRIETAARERLGLPLAFAESEEYERVDDRIAASSMGRRCTPPSRACPPSSARRSSCGSSSSSPTTRCRGSSAAPRTRRGCGSRGRCAP
jgi:hypothetical protein